MHTTSTIKRKITIEHVSITCKRTFEDVRRAIDIELPIGLDGKAGELLMAGDKVAVEDFEKQHPGLLLFVERDHGSLLRIVGRQRKAIQYEIGNPVTATKMTRHKIEAALYAPLRVLLLETDQGDVTTCHPHFLVSSGMHTWPKSVFISTTRLRQCLSGQPAKAASPVRLPSMLERDHPKCREKNSSVLPSASMASGPSKWSPSGRANACFRPG